MAWGEDLPTHPKRKMTVILSDGADHLIYSERCVFMRIVTKNEGEFGGAWENNEVGREAERERVRQKKDV